MAPKILEEFRTPQYLHRDACTNKFHIKQIEIQKLPSGAEETRARFPTATTFTPRILVLVHINVRLK
jgi:hypothetical protein